MNNAYLKTLIVRLEACEDKEYNICYNIGKCKYVVNYHDGQKTHNDGSRFFDIAIFKSKKTLTAFTKELEDSGYSKR